MTEEQELLRKTEFELLQAQINPHFLYNTLDSIIWLAESEQSELVVQMVSSLGAFFRTSLSNGKDVINLETEMKQVESYLEIQKIRYNDVLEYSIELDSSLYSYQIPKLSLQPLVENALYHGIKLKRGKGKIRLSGEIEDEQIVIRVWDNGVGMSQRQLKDLSRNVNSEKRLTQLGLMNVQQRLRLYFVQGSGLSFNSVEGEWFEVQVRFPKISH
nr:histidine kinase [Fundicoccus ignavus]